MFKFMFAMLFLCSYVVHLVGNYYNVFCMSGWIVINDDPHIIRHRVTSPYWNATDLEKVLCTTCIAQSVASLDAACNTCKVTCA